MPGNANSLSISLPRHRGFSASTPPARSSSRSARCPATPLHCQSHHRDIAGPLRRHHTRLRAHARRDARRHHFTGKLTAEASRILQLGFSTSTPRARASLRSTRRSAMLPMARQPHLWHIASCVLDTVARRQQRRRRRHSAPNLPERSSLRSARRSATSLISMTV